MKNNPTGDNKTLRVVVFTEFNWEHAIAVLRFAGPAKQTGIELLQGNFRSNIQLDLISASDIVLIQRDFPRYINIYEQIMQKAFSAGKPVILELDDLLIDLPSDHPDRRSNYYTAALLPIMRAANEATALTVSTSSLANHLRDINPNIWVLQNYLNEHIWIIPSGAAQKNEEPQMVIGYFGSDSHLPDLEFISTALLNIIRRYGNQVRLRFWGCHPPAELSEHPQVYWTPLSTGNYAEYASYVQKQHCDIFIAPLKNNQFNQSKSPLKFIEYSSLGIAGVYSNVAPFSSIVVHGKNGLLANTVEDWENCLESLIENPAYRNNLGQAAQATIREGWLLSQNAQQWTDAYQEICALPKREPSTNALTHFFLPVAEQVQEIYCKQREALAQIDEIENSLTWKVVQRLWMLRMKLIPAGSQREKIYLKLKVRLSGPR
jgi:glycosyltransferase involved in cell wall biosynthesis